jgi:hypothetical protein
MKLSKYKSELQLSSLIGFNVQPQGVKMELDSVHRIAEWPEPTCHRNIQVFLSFANFYRHFISSFLRLVKPMTDMLKGGENCRFSRPILPTPAMTQSFVELRDAFTMAPVLTHFDPAKPIYLETDASGFAIESIIS